MTTQVRWLITLTSCFILAVNVITANTNISGTVLNEQNGILPYANVLLLRKIDSILIKGAITSENGIFEIENVSQGNYLLTVSMLGFKTVYTSLSVAEKKAEMWIPSITLYEDIKQMETVEIKAKKPIFEQRIDRVVVNVQNSITSSGGSVLDVLERSPGVIVNRQSNAISMSGKSGVVVMINGKENRMPMEAAIQMLASMPAENIEQIELITTPPAKFDAEGNAGLINLVLRKSEDLGMNGSYSLKAGYGNAEKYGGSLNFNYRKGKMNLYGDYSYSNNHSFQTFGNNRSITFQGVETVTISESERDPTTKLHNSRIGVDLDVSDKTVFGAMVSGYDSKWEMDAVNMVEILQDQKLVTIMDIDNDEINHWSHFWTNINLQHTFAPSHLINLDFDYLYYKDNNPTNYLNNVLDANGSLVRVDQFASKKVTPINIWVGKLDYSKNIGDRLKLEAGVKGTHSRFENDVRVEMLVQQDWIADPDLTQLANLREDIGALYSSFTFDISDRTTLMAGLRYEYTTSNLSSLNEGILVDRKYGHVFPTLFFSRRIREHQSVQFSYNRRITRPTFNDLAPFVIFLDPNTFFSGNSALQPAITNAIKVDYRYRSWLFSSSYSRETDAISQFQPVVTLETNKQVYAATNLEYLSTWTNMVAFPIYVSNWWEMQNNAMMIFQESHTTLGDNPISLQQTTFNVTSSQNFVLPKNYSLELSGFYRSASLFGYSKMQPLGSINLGLQKKFSDDSSLRFVVSDIFKTNNWSFEAFIPEQNLNSSVFINWENRKIALTYRRGFGNGKLKASRSRSTGSEEERARVSN